ncbi:DUF4957 domain-containing protein [Dysgonomonas sp. 520]|uniref:DUF4957 domain-containing protein n=1 Tax=Dysgonomonas sp. 520 TaxID=2302931 RepID=UPI0013D3419C|nr:DUF4957 domain-containing protein [Dysgonomonas sp. 520]NDW10233.1 DUF4957 domain-containing protein [Dysgonomonas sp. 520]
MKKYISKFIIGLTIFSGAFMVACDDDIDPVIDSLDFDRLMAPVGVSAKITNYMTVNLTWQSVKGADNYVVELYKDSMEFLEENRIYTTEVSETTVIKDLESDTRYSARIKALSSEKDESKWYGIDFLTSVPDRYLSAEIGDVRVNEVTMRWNPELPATKITFKSATEGSVSVTLSDDDIANGFVTVPDLTGSTKYEAILYNDKQKISLREITTLKEGTIFVESGDDLAALIAEAKDGAAFLVLPGDYLDAGEKITIDKNISISGDNENAKPTIHAHFIVSTAASLELKYLDLDGTRPSGLLDHAVQYTATSGSIQSLVIDGCTVRNYNKSLIAAGSGIAVKINSVTINNSVVSNILTNSADCIDIRAGFVANLMITKSTFNNCAPERDFLRLDDSSATFPDETCNVSVDQCTFNAVSNSSSRRILYVRFVKNTLSVSNCIFANTAGYYTNSLASAQPQCANNNYFNAPGFLSDSNIHETAKYDTSTNYTTADPQFENASEGIFTVGNAAVTVGDPRWLK